MFIASGTKRHTAIFLIIWISGTLGCSDSDSDLTVAERSTKWQKEADRSVHNCICNMLDLESKNNTFLDYNRITAVCNSDMVRNIDEAYNLYPNNFTPRSYIPMLRDLECERTVSRWLASKRI